MKSKIQISIVFFVLATLSKTQDLGGWQLSSLKLHE